MRLAKRKSTLGLTLALLSILFSCGSVNNTFAAPLPYQLTDAVLLGGSTTNCSEEDITTTWSDITATDTVHPLSYKNTWNYQNNYNGSQANLDSWQSGMANALSAGRGWAVISIDAYGGYTEGGNKMVRLVHFDPSATLTITYNSYYDTYVMTPSVGLFHYTDFLYNTNVSCRYQTWQENISSNYLDTGGGKIFILDATSIITPPDYEGAAIPDGTTVDNDNDGLNMVQEVQQSTYDNKGDSDGDGINDLKESQWYVDRDEVFCKTSSTPYVCAYPKPTVPDIYLEIDWMRDPVSNKVFKPTNNQLNLVKTMFANEGINFQTDTGQFGGGEELEDYIAELRNYGVSGMADYFDYKNGSDGFSLNFAPKRLGIWRYLIYGNQYSTPSGVSGSTGWSEVLGDDLFVAAGSIENILNSTNQQSQSIDRDIANTIAHELGHSLCLSSTHYYMEQGMECVFQGIDNRSGDPPLNAPDSYYDLTTYKSVMNYRYQLTYYDDIGVVNYSHGTNLPEDHDDWLAVKSHIGGFSGTHTAPIEYGAESKTKKHVRSPDGLIVVESRLVSRDKGNKARN